MPGIEDVLFHNHLPKITDEDVLRAVRDDKPAVSVVARKVPGGIIVSFGTKAGPLLPVILTRTVIDRLAEMLADQSNLPA